MRPGERIPLDGRIVKGSSVLDTAALTGESVPRTCDVGDTVLSGSVNGSGVLQIAVQSPYGESTVAKILALVEHASEKKAETERFITRFSRIYTPVVVFVALLLGIGVPIFFSQSFSEWIHRALLFLVVSCPCALVISVPLSFFGGIGGASRCGVLIKGADYLERLSRVRIVAFDKTGTLTKGDFSLAEIHSPILAQNELLGIAAALEAHSVHPLAQGVMRAFDGVPAVCEQVAEYAGKGVCGMIAGVRYAIGNLALMCERGVDVAQVSGAGSVLYLAREGECLGHLVLCDEPKENAAQAIAALEKQGVREFVMLTGDRLAVARHVAKTLGITRVEAELLPDQKVERLEALLGEDAVAFVGDGVNDAPVLARADVGVAMGALGSDAAIESADIVLMKDDLSALAEAIAISKKTLRIVRQNIFFALATKAAVL
ncbi:MAG: cadmium-translocating P-type ATPase, partial [Clostridia bacterium]|nr:cadmium-translocating P-type ATPase [Clostridia bacterium]